MSKKESQADNSSIFADMGQPEISLKSKKNEILDAYHELLNKINENKQVSHQDVKRKQEEVALVAKVSEYSIDRIITGIADVKKLIGHSLEQLEQKLTEEYHQLHDLQEAIALEAASLEEFHQIKKNVDTLDALLLAQKEYKTNFEFKMQQQQKDFDQEIMQKRVAWQKEQDDKEQEKKEREQQIKKERMREEEEYKYTTMLERKKEQNAYEAKKTILEKELEDKKTRIEQELADREKNITSLEIEYKNLNKRVEGFPQELEKAIQHAENIVRETLERTYKYKMDIAEKELEGERKLNAQVIASLQAKIKEQDIFIRSLTQKTDEASNQVQAIALKALESSSYIRYHMDDTKKVNQAL
ncbi:MAG TPA: hypothetical protein VGW78_01050 [Candidatus Babeliales bacterium]|jgi:hypothetical protein|nr:hypothetical protein [Candidatus Babeliales bacterium]